MAEMLAEPPVFPITAGSTMNSNPPGRRSPFRDVQDFVLRPMRGSDLLARLEPLAFDPEGAARRDHCDNRSDNTLSVRMMPGN